MDMVNRLPAPDGAIAPRASALQPDPHPRRHRVAALLLLLLAALLLLVPGQAPRAETPLVTRATPADAQAQGQSQSQTQSQTPAQPATDAGTAASVAYDISAYDRLSQDMGDTMTETFQLRGTLQAILAELPSLPASMIATLQSKSPDGSLRWLWGALVVIVIAVLAGNGANLLFRRWARPLYHARFAQAPETRTDKIAYLLGRGIVMTLGTAVFFVVAWSVAVLLHENTEAGRITVMTGVSAYASWLVARLVFFNILVPYSSQYRMLALSDEATNGLYHAIRACVGASILLLSISLWMSRLGLATNAHKLALIGSGAFAMLALSAIAIHWRKDVAGAILGSAPRSAAGALQFVARIWHVLAILYFVVAFGMSALRILLDQPFAIGLVAAPIQSLIAAILLYAVLLLIIDRLLPRLDTRRAQAALAGDIARNEETAGEAPDDGANAAQAQAEALENEAARAPYRDLLDHGAGILTLVFAAWLLLQAWGISLQDDSSILSNLVEIAIVGFLGYMAYQAVEIAVAQAMRRQKPAGDSQEALEIDMGGQGDSRLSTLLPIFRNFLLITIVVISGMLILSQMGIDIAPLFAGAGVVGLAIGFGAQTLIRDIFSGAFYLIDDAFRKGEYIDIGGAKGTVEKISIRSMQLRHHRGALTTVPFGEIKHVQNYSRDWAIMKLAFRVTYDTDTEKMRKIIKKFGQELMNDPYYGPMFLDPLKSQGILSMEDSAMIARVKFMSKPGKQFELRKVIYAGLQELFEKNGIHFAHREVTVRVATEDGRVIPNPTPAQVAAAGAAVMGSLDGAPGPDGAPAPGQPAP
ncbi:mechanosensitive ion channel family protein [Pannonibacter tanglangensis]|uniref:Mechanosensitive ion channel n=1 Tax=Pannonibacter tanglangensis TaxID=2750084 RepID=A0ABW9ZJV1_9HYPH|nr:mechanosensitive ion channel family protein [Pannonibacter sp. XCT-34]NBN63329.1 mechanosensitive ion channel [Pannonibacter sp. XCT-34]